MKKEEDPIVRHSLRMPLSLRNRINKLYSWGYRNDTIVEYLEQIITREEEKEDEH